MGFIDLLGTSRSNQDEVNISHHSCYSHSEDKVQSLLCSSSVVSLRCTYCVYYNLLITLGFRAKLSGLQPYPRPPPPPYCSRVVVLQIVNQLSDYGDYEIMQPPVPTTMVPLIHKHSTEISKNTRENTQVH